MVPGRLSALSKMVNPRRYTDKDFMMKVGADLYGGRYRDEPGLLQEAVRHMSPPTGRGYLWQLLAAAGWTSILWLRRMKQPTLVLMGRDDPIVPVANGRILAGLMPNARLVTIDDGHLFLLSRIPDIVPVISAFSAEEPATVRSDHAQLRLPQPTPVQSPARGIRILHAGAIFITKGTDASLSGNSR